MHGINGVWYKTEHLEQRQEFCCISCIETRKRQSAIIFLDGNDFEHYYLLTNNEMISENLVVAYEKTQ